MFIGTEEIAMIGNFINIINLIADIITIVDFFKNLGDKLLGIIKSFLKKKLSNGKICNCGPDDIIVQRYFLIILTTAHNDEVIIHFSVINYLS